MRLIAIFVILFLISATILYFYDTLAAAFGKLTWHGAKVIAANTGKIIATIMAIIIGLGVLAESAPTIWDKLIYWGQCLDNAIIYRYYGKQYFIDTVNELLEKTRILLNQTNLRLQTITVPANKRERKNNKQLQHEFKQLYNNYCQIKKNCAKINKLLEGTDAQDRLNQDRQEKAKNVLNTLVMENLQISDRLDNFTNKLKNNEDLTDARKY